MAFDFRIRSEEKVQKIFQSFIRGNRNQMIPVSPSKCLKNLLCFYYGSDPKVESHISKDFVQKFLKIFFGFIRSTTKITQFLLNQSIRDILEGSGQFVFILQIKMCVFFEYSFWKFLKKFADLDLFQYAHSRRESALWIQVQDLNFGQIDHFSRFTSKDFPYGLPMKSSC